jgi:myo-inositol-1(or 4)-monophosphatase
MDALDLLSRHAAAVEAGRRAGAHLKALYADRGALAVEQKGVNDFVSRADREAEAIIIGLLAERFPDDGFVGEETGASGASDARATWVIDPLDGTTNFLKGAHNWCVSIGLVTDGAIVAGVIFDPLRDELFESALGAGTRMNGATIRTSFVSDPGSATVGLGFVPRVGVQRFCSDTQILLSSGLSFRQVGAGALMLAYVAAGRVDAYFERHMWPWDAVGGLALIAEAGGTVSSYPTGPSMAAGSAVLAAGPALYPILDGALGFSEQPDQIV